MGNGWISVCHSSSCSNYFCIHCFSSGSFHLTRGNELCGDSSRYSFVIGSPENELGRGLYEGSQYFVYFESFEMMTTGVTQAMWEEVTGTTLPVIPCFTAI